MHVQLRGGVVANARDGRRSSVDCARLVLVGQTGREHHRGRNGRRLDIKRQGIASCRLQCEVPRRLRLLSAFLVVRDGRLQGIHAGGHVHGDGRVGRHRWHEGTAGWKSRAAGQAGDDPAQKGRMATHRRRL